MATLMTWGNSAMGPKVGATPGATPRKSQSATACAGVGITAWALNRRCRCIHRTGLAWNTPRKRTWRPWPSG